MKEQTDKVTPWVSDRVKKLCIAEIYVFQVSAKEIKINWGVGIVGHVAQTGVSCNVSDCYQDSRWDKNGKIVNNESKEDGSDPFLIPSGPV